MPSWEQALGDIPVSRGRADRLAVEPRGAFHYLDVTGVDFNQIEKMVLANVNGSLPRLVTWVISSIHIFV